MDTSERIAQTNRELELREQLSAEKARADKAEAACAELKLFVVECADIKGGLTFEAWEEFYKRKEHVLSTDCGKPLLEKLKLAREALELVAECFPAHSMVKKALAALKE